MKANNLRVIVNGNIGIVGCGAPFAVIIIASERSVGGSVNGNGIFF